MARASQKKGPLTPDDVAVYGIPPKQQLWDEPDLRASDKPGKKPAKYNRGPALLKRIVGE